MRYDTNLNPDETKRPASRSAAQAQIVGYGTKCTQTTTAQTQVAQGQTVNP